MFTSRKAVAVWLYAVAAMVLGMVIIGGLTRLTHSGLSMVNWRPVTGWLPPLSEGEWTAVFDAYRRSPEFQLVNADMTIDGFRSIFWFEYVHRLLGRIVGLLFFLPMLFFIRFRVIKRAEIVPFLGLLALGGLQGFVGWWMVKSGLVDRPDVSHYRLATHLGLAAVLLIGLLWSALGVVNPYSLVRTPFSSLPIVATVLTATTLIVGALVAGLDAGLRFNTFPLMDGQFIPHRLFLTPFSEWLNTPMTVQFLHRILGVATFISVLIMAKKSRTATLSVRGQRLVIASVCVVAAQVTLGILTLLTHVQLYLAASHQLVAFVLLATLVTLCHDVTHPPPRSQ